MHRATLVVGLATIAVMLLVERFAHRLPAAMVALVLGIVASHVFDEALGQLAGRLAEAGIPLALARIHGPAIDLLEKTGVVDAIGRERVGGRVEDAVRAFEP